MGFTFNQIRYAKWPDIEICCFCAGMSFMEATRSRVRAKRLLCGFLKVLPSGRATSTPGSTSRDELFAALNCHGWPVVLFISFSSDICLVNPSVLLYISLSSDICLVNPSVWDNLKVMSCWSCIPHPNLLAIWWHLSLFFQSICENISQGQSLICRTFVVLLSLGPSDCYSWLRMSQTEETRRWKLELQK